MKPVDPRLVRYAASARRFFVLGGLLGIAQTACIIAFAWLISRIVVSAIAGAGLPVLGGDIAALIGVLILRSALVWLMEVNAARGATVVKSELRRQVLAALPRLGPSWLSRRTTAGVTTVVTHGLDALDGYFMKYLPQLILTALATPILVAVLFLQDFTSGLIVLLTLPLIPVFMMLIGWATEAAQRAQWQSLGRLSTGFLDVVEGLSTLKVFGRERRQVSRIRAVTEQYRESTMKVLRLSFLSGFALEVAASLSVALVAVSIGLRMVGGDLGLGVGLFVLLLAPEAFLPVRQVGAQFHAAADGVAATDDVFEMLEAGAGAGAGAGGAVRAGRGEMPSHVAVLPDSGASIVIENLSVMYTSAPDAPPPAVLGFSARLAPGSLTVISGPSGAGKSSVIAALLGFAEHSGTVSVGSPTGVPRLLTRDDIAWAGQKPGLMRGTVFENVTLGSAKPSPQLFARALELAGLAGVVASTTDLGVNGFGLSGGQSQRVAIARAVYRALERRCALLVLDEPSSALDRVSEGAVIQSLRLLADGGTTVLVVSHRRAFQAAADQRIVMENGRRVASVAQPDGPALEDADESVGVR